MPSNPKTRTCFVVFFLIVITGIAYWNIDKLGYLSLDDQTYIYGNAHVKSGIAPATITWAFSTLAASNWHPLTWISHMLDYQIYGLKPAGHHLTNLFFHVLNTVLLFFVLKMMTGSIIRSACVGLLFGLHPLHVESVAWISERKDVLSCCFMLLTMLLYVQFVLRKKRRLYIGALVAFAMGLMAKPMLVTLPFALLLLDYWPLCRIRTSAPFENSPARQGEARPLPFLFIEKIPFFILSFFSCVITYIAQNSGGAIASIARFDLTGRIYNAIYSYCVYIGKMMWPMHLAVFYPHPGVPSLWKTAGAAVLLLGITIMFIRLAKSRPYGIIGWLWFLGTLIPVIGIVQVGSQAMADRYTYIPLMGLFIILAWALHDFAGRFPITRPVIAAGAGIAFVLLTMQTRKQVECWKNDLTVAQQALAVTDNNYMAYSLKANYLYVHRNYEEAKRNYMQALTIRPSLISPRINLGLIHMRFQQYPEAIALFSEVLAIDSTNLLANLNCGKAFLQSNDIPNARRCFDRALKKDSLFIPTLENMGHVYERLGDHEKAAYYFSKAGGCGRDTSQANSASFPMIKE